jgi:rRNA maturation endonuclease Nob1
VKARWVDTNTLDWYSNPIYKCSNCKIRVIRPVAFCPICKAEMEIEENKVIKESENE